MIVRKLPALLLLCFFLQACNLNAPSDNGTDPEPSSQFKIISSTGLSGNTLKAEAADLDNNGTLDLVLAIAGQSNKILINDGSGGFSEDSNRLPHQGNTFDSRDIAIADLNGDAYPEILFVSDQFNGYELYINDQRGYFTDISNRIPVSDNATSVVAWDVDNSGTTDFMIGTVGQNLMLLNNGSVVFSNQTEQRLPTQVEITTDIKVGDVTDDSLLDIITSSDQGVRILVNSGSGFYVDRSNQLLPPAPSVEEIHDIELKDFNKDGLLDMIWGISGEETELGIQNRLFINQGQGVFSDETEERLPVISAATIDVEFADLDLDGDWDLLTGSANSGVHVLLNNGNGLFEDKSSVWIPEDFVPTLNDLEIADFNNDQLPDLFLSVQDGADQLLLQN